jgi:hypothetical protein
MAVERGKGVELISLLEADRWEGPATSLRNCYALR